MGRPKGSKNGTRRLLTKICPTCGDSFRIEPYQERKVNCCSYACRHKQHAKEMLKPRSAKTCPVCGKEFFTRQVKHCSTECGRITQAEKMCRVWDKGMRGQQRNKPASRQCKICHKTFAPERAKQMLCSHQCANESFKRRINLTCQVCGKLYEIRAKYADQKTCSRTCRTVWIGKTESKIEKAMEAALQQAKIPAIKQFPFGPYTCDFAIREKKLTIECDGSYWHSLPEQIEHDRKRDNYFRSHRWRTLRFDEHQIRKDIQGCIATIHATL